MIGDHAIDVNYLKILDEVKMNTVSVTISDRKPFF